MGAVCTVAVSGCIARACVGGVGPARQGSCGAACTPGLTPPPPPTPRPRRTHARARHCPRTRVVRVALHCVLVRVERCGWAAARLDAGQHHLCIVLKGGPPLVRHKLLAPELVRPVIGQAQWVQRRQRLGAPARGAWGGRAAVKVGLARALPPLERLCTHSIARCIPAPQLPGPPSLTPPSPLHTRAWARGGCQSRAGARCGSCSCLGNPQSALGRAPQSAACPAPSSPTQSLATRVGGGGGGGWVGAAEGRRRRGGESAALARHAAPRNTPSCCNHKLITRPPTDPLHRTPPHPHAPKKLQPADFAELVTPCTYEWGRPAVAASSSASATSASLVRSP